jgi:predicted ATPase
LFEQPELHLHTVAARKLANVFCRTAIDKKCRILIETHSPELFKEFLHELREGKIGENDFIAYKVLRDGQHSVVQKIEIDAKNDFDVYENWEKGISIG